MKKIISFVAVVVMLIVSLLCLTGCETSKSFTFDVETGDKIEIKLSTKGGYDITSNMPFKITKDDETICQGTFITESMYEQYLDAVEEQPGVTILDEGTKNGVKYLFFEYEEAGEKTEYNYVMKIEKSKTGVLMASDASKSDAEDCFKRLKFSVK